MGNKENRKKDYDKRDEDDLQRVKHYMEQQAKEFEAMLFASKRVVLFGFMSERGLTSLIAHAQMELAHREGVVDKPESPDDALSAEERFKKAREGV